MTMKLTKFLSIFVFFLFYNLAYSATPGFYMGAGGGVGALGGIDDAVQRGNRGPAGNLVVGFNITKNAGFEVAYRKFAQTSYRMKDYTSFIFDYYYYAYTLMFKGYIPIGQSSFDMYGLIGYGQIYGRAKFRGYDADASSNQAHATTGGVGLLYKISSNISSSLEFTKTTGNDSSLDKIDIPEASLVTLNLIYNFT